MDIFRSRLAFHYRRCYLYTKVFNKSVYFRNKIRVNTGMENVEVRKIKPEITNFRKNGLDYFQNKVQILFCLGSLGIYLNE